jgi:hypothetical protein
MKNASTRFALAALLVGGALAFAPAAFAGEAVDTVFLTNGGRVRGAVMVDDAKVVSIKLADGKTKEIARGEVMRVEYAATAAAATTEAAPVKPKARAEAEPEEAEAEAAPPPRRKKRYYDTNDDGEMSSSQREEDEGARQRRLTGARRMIAAGGSLTAIGWAAVVGGLVAVGFGAANSDGGPVLGGALVTSFSLPLAITGSVLLSIGVRQKRKESSTTFLVDEPSRWDSAFNLEPSVPPLALPSFTVAF